MIVLFAALAIDYPRDFEHHRVFLQRFFWAKSFAQGYDVAVNTRITADYRALRSCFQEQGEEPPIPSIDPWDLFYAARRTNRAI